MYPLSKEPNRRGGHPETPVQAHPRYQCRQQAHFSDKELEVALILVGSGRLPHPTSPQRKATGHAETKAGGKTNTFITSPRRGNSKRTDDKSETLKEVAGKSKTERKRIREQQRRSDLTDAFDDLSALILEMNGDAESKHEKKKRKISGQNHADDTCGMSRVELINRSVATIERLHQENQELKLSLSRAMRRYNEEVSWT